MCLNILAHEIFYSDNVRPDGRRFPVMMMSPARPAGPQGHLQNNAASLDDASSQPKQKPAPRVRQNFQETWLWSDIVIG